MIKIDRDLIAGLQHLADQWDEPITEVVNDILREAMAIKED
jgi:uncharacterized protein (DUF4415 family)